MKFSTIPPFKIFFNVPISVDEVAKKRMNRSAIQLSEENIYKLKKVFDELKKK